MIVTDEKMRELCERIEANGYRFDVVYRNERVRAEVGRGFADAPVPVRDYLTSRGGEIVYRCLKRAYEHATTC